MRIPEIVIMPGAYLTAAACILLLPFRWIICGFLGSGIHECCHLLALHAFGIPVSEIKIGACGAIITTGAMTAKQELFCAVAGPAGSLSLILFINRLPLLALFGLCQGLFNLLPVYPLDGGRILRAIIRRRLEDYRDF